MGKIESTFAILVLIDLVNSTKFIEKVGDRKAAEAFKVYDRIFRGLLIKYDGLEIDKTDGCLLIFENFKNAITYVMEYHRLVEKHLGFYSRVGIHAGVVMMHSNSSFFVARGAKPVEVEGIQKAIAARLMSLADPGQTLLSRRVAEITMSVSRRYRLGLQMSHVGDYKLKGVTKPMPVFAVAKDIKRLKMPRNKSKIKLVRKPKKTKKQKLKTFFFFFFLPLFSITSFFLFLYFGVPFLKAVGIISNPLAFNWLTEGITSLFYRALDFFKFIGDLYV